MRVGSVGVCFRTHSIFHLRALFHSSLSPAFPFSLSLHLISMDDPYGLEWIIQWLSTTQLCSEEIHRIVTILKIIAATDDYFNFRTFRGYPWSCLCFARDRFPRIHSSSSLTCMPICWVWTSSWWKVILSGFLLTELSYSFIFGLIYGTSLASWSRI